LKGGDTLKNISFQVDDELHMKLKIKATQEGTTIKEYIIKLIKDSLKDKNK
jgi:predicted HicB family RNase H-like nuclease